MGRYPNLFAFFGAFSYLEAYLHVLCTYSLVYDSLRLLLFFIKSKIFAFQKVLRKGKRNLPTNFNNQQATTIQFQIGVGDIIIKRHILNIYIVILGHSWVPYSPVDSQQHEAIQLPRLVQVPFLKETYIRSNVLVDI